MLGELLATAAAVGMVLTESLPLQVSDALAADSKATGGHRRSGTKTKFRKGSSSVSSLASEGRIVLVTRKSRSPPAPQTLLPFSGQQHFQESDALKSWTGLGQCVRFTLLQLFYSRRTAWTTQGVWRDTRSDAFYDVIITSRMRQCALMAVMA